MKCTHVLRSPNNLLIPQQIIKIEPGFPCLSDKIAEPRPGMNIKVAAFTVSEKSINIRYIFTLLFVMFLFTV